MYVGTGWRKLIGSPKLQIIFHKRATKYRSLLRKMTYNHKGSYESSQMTYKDKGSYESSPPCIYTLYMKYLICILYMIYITESSYSI